MAARSQAGGPFWDLGHLPPTLPEQDPGTAGTWRDRQAWDGARARATAAASRPYPGSATSSSLRCGR